MSRPYQGWGAVGMLLRTMARKRKRQVTTHESMIALHRYWMWANSMRGHFERMVVEIPVRTYHDAQRVMLIEPYMSYWYAGLNVVIEGWRQLKLTDAQIDGLLKSRNVALLERYRNATFHYQPRYEDKKFEDLIVRGERVATWVKTLNTAFGRYFLTYLQAHRAASASR